MITKVITITITMNKSDNNDNKSDNNDNKSDNNEN